jgi:hypothetical protein
MRSIWNKPGKVAEREFGLVWVGEGFGVRAEPQLNGSLGFPTFVPSSPSWRDCGHEAEKELPG